VSPENVIARPDVARAMASASLPLWPLRSSSRKTIRDEKRVVDRDAEADERHDVQRIDGLRRDARYEEHPGDPADDREDADAERYKRGDDRTEDDEQEHERDRKRKRLGAAEVLLEDRVESIVDREEPGGLNTQGVGSHLCAQLGGSSRGRWRDRPLPRRRPRPRARRSR